MATEQLEKYEIEIDFSCVGCQHRKWEQEQFLQLSSEQSTRAIIFDPEPENKHDPNAIKVIFRGVHCGYVAADQCADFLEFKKVFDKMQPYIRDYNYGVEVTDIKSKEGVVQWFTGVAWAVAEVPASLAKELDSI